MCDLDDNYPELNTIEIVAHTTPITHERARKSAMKFINQHFRNPDRERPLTRIPAQNDDDDILLMDYIRQQEAKDAGI